VGRLAFFEFVKAHLGAIDFLAALPGAHPPMGKGTTVAGSLDMVIHGLAGTGAAQEECTQGMWLSAWRAAHRGMDGQSKILAAEYLATSICVACHRPPTVLALGFEIKHFLQVGHVVNSRRGHLSNVAVHRTPVQQPDAM